jgi:hypothetical protein
VESCYIADATKYVCLLSSTLRKHIANLRLVVFFKNKVVSAIFVQSFLFGAVYQANLYYLPLYYQNARGWSPIVSAAMTSPMVAAQSIFSITSGQYISRMKRYGEIIWIGFGLWTL